MVVGMVESNLLSAQQEVAILVVAAAGAALLQQAIVVPMVGLVPYMLCIPISLVLQLPPVAPP
jgi:uncharacterized membrane protein